MNALSFHPDNKRAATMFQLIIMVIYSMLLAGSLWALHGFHLAYILDRIIPYGIPPLLSLLTAAFLSLFVLTLEQVRTETVLFSAICLAFTTLNLDILLLGIVTDPKTALIISRIDHFFLALILLGANLHLVYLVCEKKDQWWLVYLGYAVGLIMALFTPTNYYFKGLYRYYWGYFAKKAILYNIMSLLWLLGLIYGIFLLIKTYRRSGNPHQKDKIRYLVYGFITTGVLSLTNTPAIYGYEIYPLGTFTFIALFLLAYGLYKYNIRLALQQLRTIFFYAGLVLLVMLAGFLPALLFPAKGATFKLLLGLFTVGAAYDPIRKAWDRLLSYCFRRSPDYFQKAYYELTGNLSGSHHVRTLYQTIRQWLFSVFMNSRCSMVFFYENTSHFTGWETWNPDFTSGLFADTAALPSGDQPVRIPLDHPIVEKLQHERAGLVTYATTEQWLKEMPLSVKTSDALFQAGVIVPVFLRDRLSGILMIGSKNNDRSYSRAEKQILINLGIVLGPYIENARILENLELQVEKRTEAMHQAMEDVKRKSDIITRQNHVILSLFEVSTRIHEISAFDKLFSITIDYLRSLFPHLGFGIILAGGRSDILESGVFDGISRAEQNEILSSRATIDDATINDILNGKTLPPPGERLLDSVDSTAPGWTVLPMNIRNQQIGKMIIKGAGLDPKTRSVISIFLAQVAAVAYNKLLMRRLETIASTDGLTGAANRAFFDQEHEKAVATARRFENIFFSILIVDINGLKQINDNFGHGMGDEMIKKVAVLLKSICRETDVLSRIGGDEFAILLPATESAQARRVIDRLRQKECTLTLTCPESEQTKKDLPIRISIGLAGSDETPPESVMKVADQRMYADKEAFYRGHGRRLVY